MCASGGDIWIFDEAALYEVHQVSQGLPRLINNICDTALLIGSAMHAPRVSVEIMQQAVVEVQSPVMQPALSKSGAES